MILFPSIRGFLPQSLGFCTAGFGCEYSKAELFVNNFVYTLQAAVIFGNSVRILCLYLSSRLDIMYLQVRRDEMAKSYEAKMKNYIAVNGNTARVYVLQGAPKLAAEFAKAAAHGLFILRPDLKQDYPTGTYSEWGYAGEIHSEGGR